MIPRLLSALRPMPLNFWKEQPPSSGMGQFSAAGGSPRARFLHCCSSWSFDLGQDLVENPHYEIILKTFCVDLFFFPIVCGATIQPCLFNLSTAKVQDISLQQGNHLSFGRLL